MTNVLEAREALAGLTGHLGPMYGAMANMMLSQLSDADAIRIYDAMTRYRTILQEQGPDVALQQLQADYPDVGPYLAAFDVSSILSNLASEG